MRFVLAAAMLGCLAMMPASADEVEVRKVEAFLVLGQSGKLSADIFSPTQPIGFWNVILGDSGAGESSEDVLVVVHFKRLKNEGMPSQTLFTVTNEFGRIYLRRENFDIWFGDGDMAAKAFLLEKVTCQSVKLEVSVNGKTQSRDLPFECGE